MFKKKSGQTSDKVFLQNSAKTLVANIRFASVDNPVSTITVTSSVPDEGKTSTAILLAKALAEGGKRVLLVECDMRRRSLAGALGVHPRAGMYAVLSGQATLESAVVETSSRGVFFLDSEPHIPNPVDILASRRFPQFMSSLRSAYNYVVFDTPPLSAFVDAAVIGAITDATLLVARQDYVKRDELLSAYDQLKKAEANVIGVVLNHCDTEKSEYYYSYYAKDGKRTRAREVGEPQIAPAAKAPAAPPRRRTPAASSPATPAPSATTAPKATPRTAPTTFHPVTPPDSTAQFLVGTEYQPRSYDIDE